MKARPYHFAAIVGGAIAGSVAAEILADSGIHVVVIEQNERPYGKIEDGLPRWHLEQREQEYRRIDARLRKPGVFFLPCAKLGRDLDFQDLCANWGFPWWSWQTGRGGTENWEYREPRNSSAMAPGRICRWGKIRSRSLSRWTSPPLWAPSSLKQPSIAIANLLAD
jgi:choline dehydrogenase-like flavoprotein